MVPKFGTKMVPKLAPRAGFPAPVGVRFPSPAGFFSCASAGPISGFRFLARADSLADFADAFFVSFLASQCFSLTCQPDVHVFRVQRGLGFRLNVFVVFSLCFF